MPPSLFKGGGKGGWDKKEFLIRIVIALLLCFASLVMALRFDCVHQSAVLGEARRFRVWAPPDYDSSGTKRYPVIYYCHGCAGSWQGDQYGSYWTGGYQHPYYCSQSVDPGCDPAVNVTFNADFKMFADSHDVLIVMLDGHINNLAGGCQNYYPYDADPAWRGNEYNFPLYFREAAGVVDSMFRTKAQPQYRAVTGLSMGGYAAHWIASTNPHWVRNVSSFCAAIGFRQVGAQPYQTHWETNQWWRNLRGTAVRVTTNDQDYGYQVNQEFGALMQGAGFRNEFNTEHFWRHWAAGIDSQFLFHMASFDSVEAPPACFSHINFYPEFDVWGYDVMSGKAEAGTLVLKDVCRNSLGIATRYWLPYGRPLTDFPMTITTAPLYNPGHSYHLVRYGYRSGAFTTEDVVADTAGRLTLVSGGGMGEEVGIEGAAVAILTDTLCETIYLEAGKDTALSFIIANLSENTISGLSLAITSESPCLNILAGIRAIPDLPAKTCLKIDSAAVIRGQYLTDTVGVFNNIEYKNVGYLKSSFTLNSTRLDKEQIFQVHVADSMPRYYPEDVVVLDGRGVDLALFVNADGEYTATQWIYEGTGNGNGKPDTGEVFSVWIRPRQGLSHGDRDTWHPTIPLNGSEDPDVSLVDRIFHDLRPISPVASGLLRLNRHPSLANPVVLPVKTTFQYYIDSPGSDKGINSFRYGYGRVVLPDTAIAVEKGRAAAAMDNSLDIFPSPFNPTVVLTLSGALSKGASVKVLDLSGKLIADLSGKVRAGRCVWNASGRGSGVYVVSAEKGGLSLRKKIIYSK